MLKYVLTFILGGAVGAAGGWIFASKKKQKFADEQIEQMRLYYEAKAKEKEANAEEAKEDAVVEVETASEEASAIVEEYKTPTHTEDSLTRGSREQGVKREMYDYTQHYGRTAAMNDEYMDDYAAGLEATRAHETAPGPILIDDVEFGKDMSLKTMNLNYYIGNHVLTIEDDQDEEVIEDFHEAQSLIGDLIDTTGFANDDNDTLYIRNERMGTDYQINKMFASYEDG